MIDREYSALASVANALPISSSSMSFTITAPPCRALSSPTLNISSTLWDIVDNSFEAAKQQKIGDAAKNAFHSNPINTVFDAKRERVFTCVISLCKQ